MRRLVDGVDRLIEFRETGPLPSSETMADICERRDPVFAGTAMVGFDAGNVDGSDLDSRALFSTCACLSGIALCESSSRHVGGSGVSDWLGAMGGAWVGSVTRPLSPFIAPSLRASDSGRRGVSQRCHGAMDESVVARTA